MTIGAWVIKWFGKYLTEQAIQELMEVLREQGGK
jgi:hypothetical protein